MDERGHCLFRPEMSPVIPVRGKQAVIFDMDGVLVDSEPLHDWTFQRVAEEIGCADHGLHFPNYLGKSDVALWCDFMAKNKTTHSMEELSARRTELFLEAVREQVPIYPGLRQLLHDLQPRYKLALASGSSRKVVEGVVLGAKLEPFFPVRVTCDDVKHPKPDPESFLKAAVALHVAPDRCVVIEDSLSGVEAAHRAGMLVIAITNSLPREKLAHADHVVKDYDEIGRLLL